MKTLREGISHTVNELNKLLPLVKTSEQRDRLKRARSRYFRVWQEVILGRLDHDAEPYTEALEALRGAHLLAVRAQEENGLIPSAIVLGETALSAVDAAIAARASPAER